MKERKKLSFKAANSRYYSLARAQIVAGYLLIGGHGLTFRRGLLAFVNSLSYVLECFWDLIMKFFQIALQCSGNIKRVITFLNFPICFIFIIFLIIQLIWFSIWAIGVVDLKSIWFGGGQCWCDVLWPWWCFMLFKSHIYLSLEMAHNLLFTVWYAVDLVFERNFVFGCRQKQWKGFM